QVRIVLDRAGWFDDVDPTAAVADGEFGAPGGRIERRAEVDEFRSLPLAEVGDMARRNQVAGVQAGLRAVVVSRLRSRHLSIAVSCLSVRPAMLRQAEGLAARPPALYKLMVGRRVAPPFLVWSKRKRLFRVETALRKSVGFEVSRRATATTTRKPAPVPRPPRYRRARCSCARGTNGRRRRSP